MGLFTVYRSHEILLLYLYFKGINDMDALKENSRRYILHFNLDESNYSVFLSDVIRIERSVEITPLPISMEFISGIISYKGQVIPVIDIRKRLHKQTKEIQLTDCYIIVKTNNGMAAMIADSKFEIYELDEDEIISTDKQLFESEYIHGIAKTKSDLMLIYDLDQFFTSNDRIEIASQLTQKKSMET